MDLRHYLIRMAFFIRAPPICIEDARISFLTKDIRRGRMRKRETSHNQRAIQL